MFVKSISLSEEAEVNGDFVDVGAVRHRTRRAEALTSGVAEGQTVRVTVGSGVCGR